METLCACGTKEFDFEEKVRAESTTATHSSSRKKGVMVDQLYPLNINALPAWKYL